MPGLVRARRSFFVSGRQLISSGQVRRDNDPVVKARPDLFVAVEDAVVEQATAAPGEKRRVTSGPVSCPVDGCDYEGTERGLKIHTGQVHDDAEA